MPPPPPGCAPVTAKYSIRCNVTEGWLEIDKHYSLELCFSIEKQPETVWRGVAAWPAA